MKARDLDRRIQFQRYAESDDGYSQAKTWADHGSRIWAKKTDVSDAERMRAGEVSAVITSRFVVRYSAFTRALTPKDRLICEGITYEINGIKEGEGRHCWLEITCGARIDQ